MHHFRFRLPSFLSSDPPSRRPPRPPFRPAGVARPSPKASSSAERSESSWAGASTSQHVSTSRRSRVESRTKNENAGENGKSTDEGQGQQKKKLVIQARKAVHEGREDATESRIIRPVSAAMEHVTAIDHTETKTQKAERSDNDPKSTNLPIHASGEGSSSMSRKIKQDIKDGISKLAYPGNDEKAVTVVTLSGENKGATMQIASDMAKSDSAVHIRRGYRSNPDESPYTTSTDDEQGRKHPKEQEEEESLVKAYVNCNAQSINNSIVFQSSVAENDPGAHVNLRIDEAKKASGSPEKKPTPPPPPQPEKKPVNEPRVRRRCLRGLLAESTESETENPLKPRRHGCRFRCKGKDNGSEIF
ncbi:PREDICTED: uncharacterized protein LOC104809215 [Tarenaya hassleriana]|uniref:uncharacterized protein LOC104809215 n=1 Tax=Tarenaya hassleriana TaxID=28532 RepID=UPI00053C3158|nr:PREDICTED: uncharacterized protein LOC104809215 [Tarenaya hassleriana]